MALGGGGGGRGWGGGSGWGTQREKCSGKETFRREKALWSMRCPEAESAAETGLKRI